MPGVRSAGTPRTARNRFSASGTGHGHSAEPGAAAATHRVGATSQGHGRVFGNADREEGCDSADRRVAAGRLAFRRRDVAPAGEGRHGTWGRIDDRPFFERVCPARQPSRVHFHGRVPREAVMDRLAEASVAVFPSFAEAFAIAPLEAMAAGCPTITSALGSGPELLEHGTDGLTIDPRSPEDIAVAIGRLLSDEGSARTLAERGRQTIERRFSIDRLLPVNVAMYPRVRRPARGPRRRPRRRSLTSAIDLDARQGARPLGGDEWIWRVVSTGAACSRRPPLLPEVARRMAAARAARSTRRAAARCRLRGWPMVSGNCRAAVRTGYRPGSSRPAGHRPRARATGSCGSCRMCRSRW